MEATTMLATTNANNAAVEEGRARCDYDFDDFGSHPRLPARGRQARGKRVRSCDSERGAGTTGARRRGWQPWNDSRGRESFRLDSEPVRRCVAAGRDVSTIC